MALQWVARFQKVSWSWLCAPKQVHFNVKQSFSSCRKSSSSSAEIGVSELFSSSIPNSPQPIELQMHQLQANQKLKMHQGFVVVISIVCYNDTSAQLWHIWFYNLRKRGRERKSGKTDFCEQLQLFTWLGKIKHLCCFSNSSWNRA